MSTGASDGSEGYSLSQVCEQLRGRSAVRQLHFSVRDAGPLSIHCEEAHRNPQANLSKPLIDASIQPVTPGGEGHLFVQ